MGATTRHNFTFWRKNCFTYMPSITLNFKFTEIQTLEFSTFVNIGSQEKLRIYLLLFWLLERNIVELSAKSAIYFQNKPSRNGSYQNGNDNSVDEIQFSNNNKNTKISGQQKDLKTLPFSKISIKPVKNQQSCVKIEEFLVQEKNPW